MISLIIPQNYKSRLSVYETQIAIGQLKRIFENNLRKALNLKRVSAPLFVEPQTGLNDDLSGKERPVEFDVKETGTTAQIVHSLAKWKRLALHNYNFPIGEGLYTDMNAIRREDDLDNLHSIYVDQWDWEIVIDQASRTEEYLKKTVSKVVDAICNTSDEIKSRYPALDIAIKRDVHFITAQELEDKYPNLSSDEREHECAKEHKTIFVMKIGDKLKSGQTHGNRAPDYDDWQLNGDIIFWDETLGMAMEISSMGIRVDAATLDAQLSKSGHNDRRNRLFHRMLLNNQLPLTIGGGIGQSRLSMLLLQKAHIGEVQASVWDKHTHEGCEKAGITLL